ncbi:hypothetical protein [Mesorhizobium sp. 10J20-29]
MYWRFDLDALLSLATAAERSSLSFRSGFDRLENSGNFTDPLRQAGAPATPFAGEEGDQETRIAGHA